MKKLLYILIFITVTFSACSPVPDQKTETKQPPEASLTMLADGKLRYLEVSGTPYERGLAHGRLLKDDIQELISVYKADLKENTGEDPDAFIARFLDETSFRGAIRKWTPDLLEELRGIAEGSGVDEQLLYMFQLADEEWVYLAELQMHSCSSFGVEKSPDHPSITAQNMDIPLFYQGYQTVMRSVDEDGRVSTVLTIPGVLGITGMNDRSVSINCNTLMQLDYSREGLPVTFIVRGVLDQDNSDDALAFIRDIQHASGQNYIIGGPEHVYSMECSAGEVAEFRPFEGSAFTYHTNHPMSNEDYSETYLQALKANNRTVEEGFYECQRIKSFEQRFTADTDGIEIDDIKEVLRSRDNDGPDVVSNESTYASVIYVLSESPRFIIAPGRPHETDYIELNSF